MMARPCRELAIAHGAQFPAQDLLGHRDAIVLENPLCEINQPPAHYPVGGWIGAVLDLLGKGAPVLVLEQGRLARCLAILEALRTLGIEAQHPITDRLQADATDARRIAARAAVKNLGKRQQTTGKGGILALLGESTKLKSCKIHPKGNRHRHGESPLFAKMNHAAADLKTHNESAFQRRGITSTLMKYFRTTPIPVFVFWKANTGSRIRCCSRQSRARHWSVSP